MGVVAKAWLTLEEAQKRPYFLLKPYEGSPSGASAPELGRSQGTRIVMDQRQGLHKVLGCNDALSCLTEKGRNSPVLVTIASSEVHSRYLLDCLEVNVHLNEQK